MKKTRYHAVVPARSSQELTLDTLADAAQIHPEFIEMLVGADHSYLSITNPFLSIANTSPKSIAY